MVSHPNNSSFPADGTTNNTRTILDNALTEKGNRGESYNLRFTIDFSEADLSFDTLLGYDVVTMKESSSSSEIGRPMMPMKTILVALPSDMRVTQVRICSIRQQPLQGTYTIFPVQRPLPIGVSTGTILSTQPFMRTYLSPFPYPPQLVSVGEQTDLAGQSMIPITIFPLHYLPLQKKLTFIQSMNFVIEGIEGYLCNDYLPETISEHGRMIYEQMIKAMVINPETVALCTSPNPQPLGVPPGDYDYVIITQESWVSAFQPLANWKTQKGVPATIVTTNWIYNSGGYSGTNIEKIRAFVQDAYTTWGTTYVLIGGDIDVVPCHYKTFSSVDPDPVPNDVYYADFDNDWICEVNIGRASITGPGTGVGQIGNFINKVLTYETNPPLTNYAKNAAFFGFNLDSQTPAEQCKINIKNTYIPTTWTMTTVYDSHTGNHKTNVIAALNAGQNLVNHADHSNSDCMGTGYVNHNLLVYNSDMDALTNGNKQIILYSMGCDPAAFDVSNCIAEHFVRDNNGGGIAFIGNSRYGWYNPGQFNTLSMEYDVRFFRSIFQENLNNLGAAFSDHKNDVMQSHAGSAIYQYIYTELTLLGDPELPIWTENPSAFVVSHPQTVPLGTSSFTVHVETTTGSDVQNAFVCLWKTNEVYARGFTNSAGDATFTITPQTGGNMNITVTKQNYLPSVSTTQVITTNLPPYPPSAPNPANGSIDIALEADLNWTGGDPNPADTLTYDVYFGTSSTPPKVVGNQTITTYDPGTMEYNTTYHWKIVSWDNHAASAAGPHWSFTTTLNDPPFFGTPVPQNGSAWNPLNFVWSISINDPEGDLFSWTIQCSNGQGSSGLASSNGTKSLALSGLTYSGSYTVWVNATDASGSGVYTRSWYTFATLIDSTPPSTNISFTGTLGNDGWYRGPVTVIFTPIDTESGVAHTWYKIDTGAWFEYYPPVNIPSDGIHEISYYSVDFVGNSEPTKTANVSIDQTPPDITLTKQQNSPLEITFIAQVDDATSGITWVIFSLDGAFQFNDTQEPYEWTWTGIGDHQVTTTAYDAAGNSKSQSMSTPYTFNLAEHSVQQKIKGLIIKQQGFY